MLWNARKALAAFSAAWFQSPSHRGDGAADALNRPSATPAAPRFNPLFIGEAAPPKLENEIAAVVASGQCFNPLLIGEAAPPIALQHPDEATRRRYKSFNPLLIGEAAPPKKR